MAAKIKKGDRVIVLAGKDKGAEGDVLRVIPKADRVVVQGVNIIKRHTRQSASEKGGIVEREAAMHISNVALKDPSTGAATRVGFKRLDDGTKVRVAKKSGEVLNG